MTGTYKINFYYLNADGNEIYNNPEGNPEVDEVYASDVDEAKEILLESDENINIVGVKFLG